MIFLFKLLSKLPLVCLQGLGWLLGWLVFFASGTYRRRFIANARQAGVTRAHWLAAVGASGKLVLELPRLWLGAPVAVEWDGAKHIEAALQLGRGVLFLTPHLGCFEVAAMAYAQRYGQSQAAMTVLFRPPRKTWLRQLVLTARQRPGLVAVPTNLSGVKQLLKALKQGQAVGLLPDQVPAVGMGLMAPFFGRDAYTMTLSVRLAQQSGATLLLVWGERLAWGRGYLVHVEPMPAPLPSDLKAAVGVVNCAMERLILRCPGQYLWAYARYKQPAAP